MYLIIIASILIGGAAFTYGAMTAPKGGKAVQSIQESPKPSPKPSEKPKELSLEEKLIKEQSVINGVLVGKFPLVATDYTVNKGQLFDKGQWYGTTLTYKGQDINNRDTLRVLMHKEGGVWKLLTTPPRPLLSIKEFPDVPKTILQAINKPISLPAGADNSPAINPAV